MKYEVGQKVKIKSLDWYNENKDKYGHIYAGNSLCFWKNMASLCGEIMKITAVKIDPEDSNKGYYFMENSKEKWTDEMIEGLVEEEVSYDTESEWLKHEISLPDGYIFKDENGNVINATKIVLEKKKNEYPKTLGECRAILGIMSEYGAFHYKTELITTFMSLLICRDAYWKIAGEEMGLGKPWEPDDADYITGRYCIFVHQGNIICSTPAEDCPLTFPTEEMRDAFYDNFKELIEQCKELL